jgi:hypothetical protein
VTTEPSERGRETCRTVLVMDGANPRLRRVCLLEPWTNILLQSAFARKEGRTCLIWNIAIRGWRHQAWFTTGNSASLQRLKTYGFSILRLVSNFISLWGKKTHLKQQEKKKENTDVIRSFTEPHFHLHPLQSRTHRRIRYGVKQIYIYIVTCKGISSDTNLSRVRVPATSN